MQKTKVSTQEYYEYKQRSEKKGVLLQEISEYYKPELEVTTNSSPLKQNPLPSIQKIPSENKSLPELYDHNQPLYPFE